MQFLSVSSHRRPKLGTMFLVLTLLFAQWLGLAHRVEHAGSQHTTMHAQAGLAAVPADSGVDKSLNHSCALFDGAALAAALNSPSVSPALLPGAQILALWLAFASWDAPFLCHFSSRAPPAV